nr:tRNA threonylcarbamoyladenosine dehydratase [Clostridia bacterium]
MNNWLSRTEGLIGKKAVDKLKNSHVTVCGCGGVGSYVIEGLVRAGIGNITIIDNDVIDISNINRQLMADFTVIGQPKVEVERKRLLKINPELNINIFQEFIDTSNFSKFVCNYSEDTLNHKITTDYIIDAIDSVSSKLDIIEYATQNNIPIISSMGTGNKLNPTKFELSDISKTSVCPLAKVIRKELRNRGINHLKVLYSKETPNRCDECSLPASTPASISFVPSVAGLIIAGEVIKDLIKE